MTFLAAALAQLPVALLGFNLEQFLLDTGPWVLVVSAIIVFIESGVLFPVLPGDSLIFALGMLHQQMGLSLWVAFPVLVIVAMAGAEVGYQIGARYGRNIFKDDAKILSTKNLHTTEEFFQKRGSLALVLGRFVPIVRTFIPVAAGTAKMPYKNFVGWNVSGAILWVVSMNLVGVFLGNIPGIADSIEKIMLLIIFISVLPIIIKALHSYIQSKKKATVVAESEPVARES